MPTNDTDARALAYLARRLRAETYGARDWDEAGTYAVISRLAGQQLASVAERVIRHATDPEAKTPGAINRPFVPAAAEPGRPMPPKVDQACHTCGRELDGCICGERQTRPARADKCPPTEDWAKTRAALRGERSEG